MLDSRRNFPGDRDEPGEEGESTLGAPEQLEGGLSPQDHLRSGSSWFSNMEQKRAGVMGDLGPQPTHP